MVLNIQELISSIGHQICLESQVEWNIQSNISAEGQTRELDKFDPFQNSCIFVNNFSLLKVQFWIWPSIWLLYKGLVQVNWVENIVLEFEKPVDWSTQELWMTKPVSNELVLFLRFHFNIVFVTFRVEMFGDWSVGSFMFPLFDMLEVMFFVPGGIGNKSILVGEDDFLFVDIEPIKSEIFKLRLDWTILVDIGINTPDTVFVWPVKITDGLPDFSLDFQVVFEIVNDGVVFFDLCFVMVLVKFGVDVLW